jgi:hypothetical protein
MNPSEIAAILHQRITSGAPFIIGIDGCGESARDCWLTKWMPEEDGYVSEQTPQTRADLVYDGSGETS